MIVQRRYGDVWSDVLTIVPAVLGTLGGGNRQQYAPPPPVDHTGLYIAAGLGTLLLLGGFALVISRQGD